MDASKRSETPAGWLPPAMRRWIIQVVCAVVWALLTPCRLLRRRQLRRGATIREVLICNDVAGLGNLVLLTGLLLNVRRLYPHARITVVLPPTPFAAAVFPTQLADQVAFLDPSAGWRERLRFARRALRPRRFDLGFATFFSPTLLTSSFLFAARCRYRVAYATSPHRGCFNTLTLTDAGGHELDRHLQLLAYADADVQRRTALLLTAEGVQYAQRFMARHAIGSERPVLGVHPGCDRQNALKRWPIDRFVSVIRRIVDTQVADVLVFLGPDDLPLRPALAERLGGRAHLVSAESFEHVSGLISQCHGFLTNDSGLMHVAAALHVPVTAIFGPTGIEKNAPVGEATVLLARDVQCRPCYRGVPIQCMHDRQYCLEAIGVEDVFRSLRRMLVSARWSASHNRAERAWAASAMRM